MIIDGVHYSALWVKDDPWIKRCKKLAKVGCWRRGWLKVDDLIGRGEVGQAEPKAKL